MNAATRDIPAALGRDFTRVASDLARARVRRSAKDTPANRAAVDDRLARIDALLDMYLDSLSRIQAGRRHDEAKVPSHPRAG